MRAKGRIIELREFAQAGRAQLVARGELGLAAFLRELVPGAGRETIVAAIDAIADRLAKLVRDRSLVLDGEVGNAAPRVELVGRGKRRGRTDVETGLARAAMIGLGLVARQVERGVDRAEKQPGAEPARDQVGVLALPAEAGGLRQRLFHYGRGID